MSNRTFLGLGTNVGDRYKNLNDAQELLGRTDGIVVTGVSPVYITEPTGYLYQNDFLNAVIEVSTLLTPDQLLKAAKKIETRMGRKDALRWGPRIIDIDILYHGNTVINTEELQIPHRMIADRRFVLTPLSDIAGEFICPVSRQSIDEMLYSCSDLSRVEKLVNKSLFTEETKFKSAK